MAKPRIFLSSTYYDLKHIRSSLELFIESAGYDPVLSEKGDIAYAPDWALDESCYREAATADIFVLIIGGRYGSATSTEQKDLTRLFFDRYESITKKEFDSAHEADIPVFVLIESGVYSEYQTYLKNKDNVSINYAHVDSINVFQLIEDILVRPRNNPVFTFERSSEIEAWLREQWAGLFREMLRGRSQQKQLSALTGQVSELKIVSETLKKYLEVMLTKTNPAESSELIETEKKRLQENRVFEHLKENGWFIYLCSHRGITDEVAIQLIKEAESVEKFVSALNNTRNVGEITKKTIVETIIYADSAQDDLNAARALLGLPASSITDEDDADEWQSKILPPPSLRRRGARKESSKK